MTPLKIMVTGGAGFIGSHLCKNLVNEGHNVICIDNLLSGNLKNLSNILEHPRFSFFTHDIVNPIEISGELDQIYNLACQASPPKYQNNPIHTTKTSVYGVINMLELAKQKKARFFQASTSEVYGNPNIHPQIESYWGNVNPHGIRSCYDEGKRCAESLCFDYYRTFGVEIRIARIFNTYGPYMDPNDGRVVSNFIIQALRNNPITVYGTGGQTRSFCYIDDLIEAILKLMNSSADIRGPINLGNPEEFTILELATKIISKLKSSSTINFCDIPADDPERRQPNISIAHEKLGWKPLIDLDSGLVKTIEYFQSVIG